MIVIIHSLNRNVSSAFYFIGVYGIVFVFLLNINSSTLAYIKNKKRLIWFWHLTIYYTIHTHTRTHTYMDINTHYTTATRKVKSTF